MSGDEEDTEVVLSGALSGDEEDTEVVLSGALSGYVEFNLFKLSGTIRIYTNKRTSHHARNTVSSLGDQ